MAEINELAQKMLELDEDTLKARLGIQVQEMAQDTTARSASLENLDDELAASPRGFSLDSAALKFGDEFFKRLNIKSYNLMCGELFDDAELQEKFLVAFKEGSDRVVTLLTPILVANLGMAYSIAMFIAVLIVKTLYSATSGIASATSESICTIWKGSLADEKEMLNDNKLPKQSSISEQPALT